MEHLLDALPCRLSPLAMDFNVFYRVRAELLNLRCFESLEVTEGD
jgi:hypothetical protein